MYSKFLQVYNMVFKMYTILTTCLLVYVVDCLKKKTFSKAPINDFYSTFVFVLNIFLNQ